MNAGKPAMQLKHEGFKEESGWSVFVPDVGTFQHQHVNQTERSNLRQAGRAVFGRPLVA